MARIQNNNGELILEFARLNSLNDKYMPSSQYDIIVHDGKETGKHNIPHFHIESKDGEYKASIKLLNYEPSSIEDIVFLTETGKLNNRRNFLNKLLSWLNSISNSDKIRTNTLSMYNYWNDRFPKIQIDKWIDKEIKPKKKNIFTAKNEFYYLNTKDFAKSELPFDRYYLYLDTTDTSKIYLYDNENNETIIIKSQDDNKELEDNELYQKYLRWLKDRCYSETGFENNEEYLGYILSSDFDLTI